MLTHPHNVPILNPPFHTEMCASWLLHFSCEPPPPPGEEHEDEEGDEEEDEEEDKGEEPDSPGKLKLNWADDNSS